jgi:hypothetical protein
VWAANLQGTVQQPIVIEGSDEKNPPLFEGGTEAWHLSACAYLTLRNIAVRKQTGNGINIDDGGTYETPAHHITLEKLHVADIGPQGNHDAIKLSGVDDFVVRDCTVEGWGGQAVDMVGCHQGLIEKQFSFETTGHRHMTDVTDQVAAIVARSGVKAEQIIHLECDVRPRRRTVVVTIMGE